MTTPNLTDPERDARKLADAEAWLVSEMRRDTQTADLLTGGGWLEAASFRASAAKYQVALECVRAMMAMQEGKVTCVEHFSPHVCRATNARGGWASGVTPLAAIIAAATTPAGALDAD